MEDGACHSSIFCNFASGMDYKLNKSEKLTSRTAIERLFEEGKSLMAFPLRAAYRLRQPGDAPVQFLISIPKKRIRKAVNRVLLRRRTREAYRLNRHELLTNTLHECGIGVDIAFVYLDTTPAPYEVINEKMTHLLSRIAHVVLEEQQPPNQSDEK